MGIYSWIKSIGNYRWQITKMGIEIYIFGLNICIGVLGKFYKKFDVYLHEIDINLEWYLNYFFFFFKFFSHEIFIIFNFQIKKYRLILLIF